MIFNLLCNLKRLVTRFIYGNISILKSYRRSNSSVFVVEFSTFGFSCQYNFEITFNVVKNMKEFIPYLSKPSEHVTKYLKFSNNLVLLISYSSIQLFYQTSSAKEWTINISFNKLPELIQVLSIISKEYCKHAKENVKIQPDTRENSSNKETYQIDMKEKDKCMSSINMKEFDQPPKDLPIEEFSDFSEEFGSW